MEDLGPRPGDLETIETASVDELRALQTERLRWSVRHAYEHVPHYRASLDAVGVHPDDVRELADLARLPFTAKADLREVCPADPQRMRCLDSLVADGLVEPLAGDRYRLPA